MRELFRNAGGLITQMTDVNKLSLVVVVIEIPHQAGAQTWWQFQTTERAPWLLTDINRHSCILDHCFIGQEGVHSFTAHFLYCRTKARLIEPRVFMANELRQSLVSVHVLQELNRMEYYCGIFRFIYKYKDSCVQISFSLNWFRVLD